MKLTYTLELPDDTAAGQIDDAARQLGWQERVPNPDHGKDRANPGPLTIDNPVSRVDFIAAAVSHWLGQQVTARRVQRATEVERAAAAADLTLVKTGVTVG